MTNSSYSPSPRSIVGKRSTEVGQKNIQTHKCTKQALVSRYKIAVTGTDRASWCVAMATAEPKKKRERHGGTGHEELTS